MFSFWRTPDNTSFIKLQHAFSEITKEHLWFNMFTLMFTILVFLPSISIIAWAPITFSLSVQTPWRENNANRPKRWNSQKQTLRCQKEIIQYLWLKGLTLTATFTEAIVFLKNSKTNRNNCCLQTGWNLEKQYASDYKDFAVSKL